MSYGVYGVWDGKVLATSRSRRHKPDEFVLVSAEQKTVRLIPYDRIAHERYATYWQIEPSAA